MNGYRLLYRFRLFCLTISLILLSTTLVGNPNPLTLTSNQRPSFFIYVPYTAARSDDGEFILRDKNGEKIWRREFQLLDQSGIVRITFPQTEQPLEIDTTYYWYFEVS